MRTKRDPISTTILEMRREYLNEIPRGEPRSELDTTAPIKFIGTARRTAGGTWMVDTSAGERQVHFWANPRGPDKLYVNWNGKCVTIPESA